MTMAQPPVARVAVVRDTYFGTTLDDPYRWMEDLAGEEAQTWLAAQAAYAGAVLRALPERDALLARISALGDAGPDLTDFQVAGARTFYLRRDPGGNLPRLVVRATHTIPNAPDTPERVLLDPSTLPGKVHTAIDWYAPSHDGHYVAYGVSPGGSEDSTLHVLDVESGAPLAVAIPHCIFGEVNWLEDNQSFVYNRSPEPTTAPGAAGGRYENSRVYLHHLSAGSPADGSADTLVFGADTHPQVPTTPIDIPAIALRPSSAWMVGVIQHGDLRERTLYVAPRTGLASPATCPWTRVADVEDAVTAFDFAGDTLYLRTHRDAPRRKVLAVDLRQPDLAHAREIVPQSPVVIEDLRVAGDYLLLRDLDGGIGQVRRLRRDATSEPEVVPLPVKSSITSLAGDAASPEVLLELTSWTVPPRIVRYDSSSGALADTGWLPPSPVDFSAIEAHEVLAPAADGTLIPLSIVHRLGLRQDGANPTLLIGYGSYGVVLSPFFMPQMLAWYERGGVLAVAHMRGGGEFGAAWHHAGRLLNKEHTIGDFIACAEYLVAQGYTTPARLAGQGGSAGGIPTGGALVRRPDLFAVMVMNVPVTNALRAETTENGPPNVPEFGGSDTEEGFRALQIIDSYLRVRDGVAYPAVLLTTGANDPRVVPWMAMKMAARLQAATESERPVLLRVEYEAGHGMGSTKRQRDEELADTLAFLLARFGV